MQDPEQVYPLLPRLVPKRVAAKIAGLSSQTFSETYLKPGFVRVEDNRVVLASLASALGRLLTMEEYLAALKSLQMRRESQRQYAERRRAIHWGIA